MTEEEIEHMLSMVFPDVRLKIISRSHGRQSAKGRSLCIYGFDP